MSVSVDLFTELKVNGRWVCIDPWIIYSGEDIAHRDVKHLLPLLSGGSAVYWIVRDIEMTAMKPRDLSGTLQAELHLGDDDRVYGIPGYYFASRDFDVPEYCGYFPRQEVLSLRNDPGYEVNTDEFLPVQQYLELSADAQRAFEYMEYTEPWGERDICRRIERGIKIRLGAFEDYGQHYDGEKRAYVPDFDRVGWSDLRVIVRVS